MTSVPKSRLERSPAPQALQAAWKRLRQVDASIVRIADRAKKKPDRFYDGQIDRLRSEKTFLLSLLNHL